MPKPMKPHATQNYGWYIFKYLLDRGIFDSCSNIYLTEEASHAKGWYIYLTEEACHAKGWDMERSMLTINVNKVMLTLKIALVYFKVSTSQYILMHSLFPKFQTHKLCIASKWGQIRPQVEKLR